MMSNRSKTLAFLSVAMLFIWHFSMTILHNIPERYIGARSESYSHLWCYPVFHQGWALFAPDPPPKTKHLDYAYYSQGQWTDWIRPADECESAHQALRLSHQSKLYHVIQNTAFHLWHEKDRFDQQDRAAEDYYPVAKDYAAACHLGRNFAYHFLPELSPDSLKVRLVLEDPYSNEVSELIEFPTYPIGDD